MTRQLSQKPSAHYARGYNTAMRRLADMREEWKKAVERIRERMLRAEQRAGIGQCSACVFWQREGKCLWGYCHARDAADGPMWPMPWAYMVRDKASAATHLFCTSETFGCINFKTKAGPLNEE